MADDNPEKPPTEKLSFSQKLKSFLCSWGSIISLAALFVFLALASIDIKTIQSISLVIGLFSSLCVFIFCRSHRLVTAIIGIVGFDMWLLNKGIDKLEKLPAKETVFIIAIAILAWLAMSCYALSLLKDNQSEND